MDDLVNAHNYDDQIQAQRRAKAKATPKEPLYDGKKKQAPKRKRDEEEDESESEDISSDEEEQNQTFMQKLGGFLFFGCGGGAKR